uniref:Arf-GAP with coiled-coil, ANK repeat and PH domain-containing protein n=1 Tax=Tetraselmis sp. GSL018 TaxID=582737 RepID=A0A061R5X4_9CHLO|mmetsp:Transcript_8480/g.20361  ORF Transcript_8480/g.20361 Transcript_8480/m.20361 type:complete len:840 (-) Transcript_8480:224-2743(-)|eukprot:CAMPEP_0177601732 /NCGR_PEP_ID=MMETSP0419_2-20121207/14439_1 /TAXON_ID=582737 /ORGANISM="Tetraselmis sp., Strain GSL018" /LENGTH=839 /DNA_ID=CAMNT_0019095063 /DNA_START=246 /DNA_END=2765 /DNA_ORIENTATION=+
MGCFTTLDDSPMLRCKLQEMESSVDGLKDRCKLLTKASRKYRDGLLNMHQSEKEFASALEEVCMDNDEDHVAMGSFVTVLNQLATYHHTLHTQIEELLFEPLQRWQVFLSEVKDLRRKLDKSGSEYDEQRSRYLSMKKKTKPEVLEKQAAELQSARRDFDEARFAVAQRLAAVEVRKKYEFLDALASSMEAHMHFFRRGLDLFSGLEPKIQSALEVVEGHRAEEKHEEELLESLVAVQRDNAAARTLASSECASPSACGPLQFTGQAARKASEIESVVRASLEGGGQHVSIIKQGYLYKRSSNMRGGWKRRFFILDSLGTLCYYRNKDAHSAASTVNLLFSTVKPNAEDPSLRCCFRIVSSSKTYTLQAENETEVTQWMEALQAVIAVLINNSTAEQLRALTADPPPGMNHHRGRHRRNLSVDSDISVQSEGDFAMVERVASRDRHLLRTVESLEESTPPNAALCSANCFAFRRYLHDASGGGQQPNRKDAGAYPEVQTPAPPVGAGDEASLLEVLRRVPGNSACADCGAADPDWASLSFGVTLCIECSGVHRQMGVHISKVRSLTLDVRVWEPSVVQMFQQLGNQFVNSVLEEKAPRRTNDQEDTWLWSADSDGEDEVADSAIMSRDTLADAGGLRATCKPSAGDGLAEKEKFAVAKYIDRRFTAPCAVRPEELRETLWEAVASGDLQGTLRLILKGGDVNEWHAHIGSVRLMSEALEVAEGLGIPVPETVTERGAMELSLLHLAAKVGATANVELLLQRGAAIDAPDMYGRTPLHYAILFQQAEAAKLLIRKGADASLKDMSHCNALDTAVTMGRVTDEELFLMLSGCQGTGGQALC